MSRMRHQAPTNLTEVRTSFASLYQEVMTDRAMVPQVKEGANCLGKLISTCKVHLECAKLSRVTPSQEWREFMQTA